jgi:hypothetical protein
MTLRRIIVLSLVLLSALVLAGCPFFTRGGERSEAPAAEAPAGEDE